MAHIPQPPTNSPGEQIQSTDTVPPLVSIETTAPSPSQDIQQAVGEFNNLDAYFYQQFRRLDTVRWSVSDASGKLLWYVPINPLNMDKQLAYVTKMYLAWVGDFVFNFKIAGTGFHAGMVTIVKTPPTIHPSTVTNPMDYTIFPWDGMDPKMLEIGSMYGRDIRPIKYHYVRKQDNAPPDYYLGGYLALFVDLPLATSSSGVTEISIGIWVKNAPAFQVAWMVPISLQQDIPSIMLPDGLANIFNFANTRTFDTVVCASAPVFYNEVAIRPKAYKELNVGIYNCFGATRSSNAVSLSKLFHVDYPLPTYFNYISGKINSINEDRMSATVTTAWNLQYDGIPKLPFQMEFDGPITAIVTKTERDEPKENYVTFTFKEALPSGVPSDSQFKINYSQFAPVDSVSGNFGWIDNVYTLPVSEEGFLMFKQNTFYSAQSLALSQYFASGILAEWIPQGQCALFQIVDTDYNLPFGYVKLYRYGYMSSRATENEAILQTTRLKFVFESFIQETAHLPENSQISTNALFMFSDHRRSLKLARATSKLNLQLSKGTNYGGDSSSSSGSSRTRQQQLLGNTRTTRLQPWNSLSSIPNSTNYSE